MSDKHSELCGLLATIARRRTETETAGKEIKSKVAEVFDEHSVNIEKIRSRARKGDACAQAAYMALLRGRHDLRGVLDR